MWKYVTVVDLINKLTGQQLKNIKWGEKSKLRKLGVKRVVSQMQNELGTQNRVEVKATILRTAHRLIDMVKF